MQRNIIKYSKRIIRTAKETFTNFMEDNGMKLSAALSYYTIFSLGPMLIIIISLTGIFYGQEAVEGKLYWQIKKVLGHEASVQVQQIIQNIQSVDKGVMGTIIGTAILIIGATGIFTEIQDSINFIWSIKAKPKRGLIKFLFNRMLSFSLIVSLGFLLIVSLLANTLMALLSERLGRLFTGNTVLLFYLVNQVLIFGVISLLFAVIFKVLPDGKIKWKDALFGAAFTAVLFMLGKAAIGFYLGSSALGTTYGAAASIVIILTWVYYISMILYFGAEFTKIYALEFGNGIVPNDNAVFIIKSEVKEIDIHNPYSPDQHGAHHHLNK